MLLFALYAMVGISLIVLFIAIVYISIKEKMHLFFYGLFIPIIGILMIVVSFDFVNRTGTVCEVVEIQTGYVETIINGEIELVPSYSYQILFLDEDGKYRTFTTTDIHYAVLKEGDSITYTEVDTDRVKEN